MARPSRPPGSGTTAPPARRKGAPKRAPATAAKAGAGARTQAARTRAAPGAPRKRGSAAAAASARSAPAAARPAAMPPSVRASKRAAQSAPTEAERTRRFRMLLHTACLKAGTAAAATTLSTRVPLLNRIAPLLVGSRLESVSVARIQQQLVLDVLELYGLSLSELERQGVILLATAANVGAQELSRRTVEQLVNRVGAPLGRPLLDRMLPVTHLVAENAAAIASTYAVGRRAQALCRLSGSGARDLGELLGTITGIDQRQLLDWSTEAAKLALKPFRAALMTLRPRA